MPYACRLLDELVTADFVADDGIELGPDEIHAYLQRVLYNRRNKCAELHTASTGLYHGVPAHVCSRFLDVACIDIELWRHGLTLLQSSARMQGCLQFPQTHLTRSQV
jgi:hypothetical protein